MWCARRWLRLVRLLSLGALRHEPYRLAPCHSLPTGCLFRHEPCSLAACRSLNAHTAPAPPHPAQENFEFKLLRDLIASGALCGPRYPREVTHLFVEWHLPRPCPTCEGGVRHLFNATTEGLPASAVRGAMERTQNSGADPSVFGLNAASRVCALPFWPRLSQVQTMEMLMWMLKGTACHQTVKIHKWW